MTFLEQELKKMVGKEPAFTEQRYVGKAGKGDWGVKSSNRGIKKAEPYVAASPGGR